MTLHEHLISLCACMEAVSWASGRTAEQAWQECNRADWMIWWAGQTSLNRYETVSLTASTCCQRALQSLPGTTPKMPSEIKTAQQWAIHCSEQKRQTIWPAVWVAEAAIWVAVHEADVGAAWERVHCEMCDFIRARLKQPWSESP